MLADEGVDPRPIKCTLARLGSDRRLFATLSREVADDHLSGRVPASLRESIGRARQERGERRAESGVGQPTASEAENTAPALRRRGLSRLLPRLENVKEFGAASRRGLSFVD